MTIRKLLLMSVSCFMLAPVWSQKITRAEYLERYKGIAIAHMEKYGIPASIKMAQAMLESDNGNSRLAREANNHFGIKCKSDWTGKTISHDDDASGECFRRYDSAEESWIDHSEFLDKGSRYQFLFELDPMDYKAWAHGLKKAGYATNPRYPDLLIQIIEDNELYLLDRGEQVPIEDIIAHEESRKPKLDYYMLESEQVDIDNYVISMFNLNGYEIYSNNGSRFIVAREGDDLSKISNLFGISAKRLRKFNDLTIGQEITSGNMVYIESKNGRSDSGEILHTVREGETLHSISQHYGIRLKSLARRNHYDPDVKLFAGQQIKL